MSAMLETHRRLYNDALAERKQAWEQEQRSVSYGEQSGHLKAARTTNAFLAATNFSSCQATLRRLDKAFGAFFRRIKASETPGYPRFIGRPKPRCGWRSGVLRADRREATVAGKPCGCCKSNISGSAICGGISTTRQRVPWFRTTARLFTKI
jgi:transposase